MHSVAVIAEFNPFHNGHSHLLRCIREQLGEDTAVTALMSGWFVQRGEIAVASPYVRAECALRAGFDLVLELPFPFSASSAEYFARAGVSLAEGLSCFDTLAFGCESGELAPLLRIAEAADTPAYRSALSSARETEHGRKSSFAALSREALATLLSKRDAEQLLQPNNTLAVEYLRALRCAGFSIAPLAVKRRGQGYHDSTPTDEKIASASAIRALLSQQEYEKIRGYVKAEAFEPLARAISRKEAPVFMNRLSDAILAFFIAPSPAFDTADNEASLRLRAAAVNALDLDDLLSQFTARTDTGAHARRTLLHAYLGVTSSELREPVRYTRVLGFRDRGRELLRIAKRKGSVALLTKTADYTALPSDAARQAERSLRADRLSALALPRRRPAGDVYRGAPRHIRSL